MTLALIICALWILALAGALTLGGAAKKGDEQKAAALADRDRTLPPRPLP